MAVSATNWVVTRAGGKVAVRLLCFPHAGGSYCAFADWHRYLPNDVQLVSFCYPGRLRLVLEEPVTALPALVQGLATAVEGLLDLPFVCFGHSLGGLVAFELARRLRETRKLTPAALIVSGHAAPEIPARGTEVYRLPPAELLAYLRTLEGVPPSIEANEKLLPLVLPAIRADLRMHEGYRYVDAPPLSCPIIAMTGRSDPQVILSDVDRWRGHTADNFSIKTFEGGHFFIFSHVNEVLGAIRETLMASLRR